MTASLPKFLRLPAGLLLLAVLGCGLAEYEEKMKQTKKRLDRHDEEKKLLDDPLEMPTKKVRDKNGPEREEPLEQIFLRLPLGIPKKAYVHEGIFWRYGYPKKPAAAGANQADQGNPPSFPTGVTEVDLTWESGKVDQSKFVSTVLGELQKWYPRKDPRLPPTMKQWDALLPEPGELRPIGTDSEGKPDSNTKASFETFEWYDYQDHFCLVAFRTKGKLHVAVFYRVEKGKQTQAEKAIRLSLESLALDKDEIEIARNLAGRFPSRSQPTPPPSGAGQPAQQ